MNTEIQEIQVACFWLGEDLYAVDIMRIKEIIRPLKLASLPKAPPFVEGVINLRGTVIPIVDLRKRFDLPYRPVDQSTRLLIVSVARQALGLVVDDVTEVITMAAKDIKAPPQVTRGVGAEYLVGVCLAKDNLIMLLNIDRILTDQEAGELGRMGDAGKELIPEEHA
ncbi:MAG: purine-binding chemotaxis protein [Geobacteraceae bacterium]|nr:MAG: purine-binding chemotaxis protein [Geobacteraceae bacterium]